MPGIDRFRFPGFLTSMSKSYMMALEMPGEHGAPIVNWSFLQAKEITKSISCSVTPMGNLAWFSLSSLRISVDLMEGKNHGNRCAMCICYSRDGRHDRECLCPFYRNRRKHEPELMCLSRVGYMVLLFRRRATCWTRLVILGFETKPTILCLFRWQ